MSAMDRIALVLLVAVVACGERAAERASAPRTRTPGPRLSMDALHAMGGVPAGWQLTPPPGDVAAGRTTFVDYGCPSCHRVEGEPFSAKSSAGNLGPDLTGMGAHHPPGYFAEAILNPDAVLIDGPGYIGPDGHSIMPDYPEMTTRQLGDLVAYLSSLKTGGPHAGHVMPPPGTATNVFARPDAPRSAANVFLSQSYDVKPNQLPAFEAWWKSQGAQRFAAVDGLVSVDTYVDVTRTQRRFTSVFGFRDAAALQAFTSSPATEALGLEFDAFIGDHDHDIRMWPPIYRAPSLSTLQ
jgi:hypothetical protein